MAVFRATNYWRAMLRSRMRIIVGSGMNSSSSSSSSSRMYATASSTLPKMKPFAPTADHHHHANNIHQQQQHSKPASKFAKMGEFFPIYVVAGLVMVALAFGVHTAKQQLRYSPSVQVSKKKRESVPEVEDPDYVLGESDKFINKSILRKVAHIQDSAAPDHLNPDAIRGGDVFTSPRKAETLKSAGVNPSKN